jgi:hypothetical protein
MGHRFSLIEIKTLFFQMLPVIWLWLDLLTKRNIGGKTIFSVNLKGRSLKVRKEK